MVEGISVTIHGKENYKALKERIPQVLVEHRFVVFNDAKKMIDCCKLGIKDVMQMLSEIGFSPWSHDIYESYLSVGSLSVECEIKYDIEDAWDLAVEEIQDKKSLPHPVITNVIDAISPVGVIDCLLNVSPQGFIVGEVHTNPAARYWLLSNVEYFKEKGIEILFVEFLPVEWQSLIDEFMNQRGEELSPILIYLLDLRETASLTSLTKELLIQAKKNQLKIVGIDSITLNDHLGHVDLRLISMNTNFLSVYEKFPGKKSITLTGALHATAVDYPPTDESLIWRRLDWFPVETEILGLRELTGLPAIDIFLSGGSPEALTVHETDETSLRENCTRESSDLTLVVYRENLGQLSNSKFLLPVIKPVSEPAAESEELLQESRLKSFGKGQ
ncbi:MAG: hypothetical protein JSS53_10170 [Proteobacteria bacterium]|nr:hypothetical protein [Pseudomonadota bacterium]